MQGGTNNIERLRAQIAPIKLAATGSSEVMNTSLAVRKRQQPIVGRVSHRSLYIETILFYLGHVSRKAEGLC